MTTRFSNFAAKTRWLLLAATFAILGVFQCVFGATYFVELGGSDSNPGSSGQPWRTIQKAANVAIAGDTVMVGSGDFGEIVNPRNSGTAGNFITFDGQGIAITRQFQISKEFIKVRNFTLKNLTDLFTGMIQLNLGANGAYIEGNHIDPNYSRAVRGVNWDLGSARPMDVRAASNVTVTNNIVEHIFDTPAILVYGTNSLIISNTLRTIRDADYFHVFGISNVVRGNSCIGFEDTPLSGNHMDCFQTFGNLLLASHHITIEGNVFGYNFNPTDIDVAQLCQMEVNNDPDIHDWDIRNNVFFNVLKGECGVPSTRWNNNVFYQIWTNSSGGALIFNWSADGRNNATNTQVLNNVFLECGRGDNQSGWYSWGEGSSTITNTWSVDYNYVGGPGFATKNQGLPVTNQRWFEPHGINGGDPKFANPAAHDFRIRKGSILADVGFDLTGVVSTDIRGVVRPQGAGFDIGAYELTLPRPATNLRIVP